jgi:hypothetical protein
LMARAQLFGCKLFSARGGRWMLRRPGHNDDLFQ